MADLAPPVETKTENVRDIIQELRETFKELKSFSGLTIILLAVLALWIFDRATAENLLLKLWTLVQVGGHYTAGAARKAGQAVIVKPLTSLRGRALTAYDSAIIALEQYFNPIRRARWLMSFFIYTASAVLMLIWGIYAHGNYQLSLANQNLGNIIFVISVIMILAPLTIILWVKKTIANIVRATTNAIGRTVS